jgi:hypothetical protein
VQTPSSGGLPVETLNEHPGWDTRPRMDAQWRFEFDRDCSREPEPQRVRADLGVVTARSSKHYYHECAGTAEGEPHYATPFVSDP